MVGGMTTLRDHAGAVRRYLLGEASYSPRLENVVQRILDTWAHQQENRQAITEAQYDDFARAACDIARQMVDTWRRGERDADDRLVQRRPSKNAVALAAFQRQGGKSRSRSRANELYEAAMTPDRLARLGLTNALDEVSADTRRTLAR